MSNLWQSLDPFADGLLGSGRWLRVENVLCACGTLLALGAALRHAFAGGRSLLARLATLFTVLAVLAGLASVFSRGVEVNHFPSQTMSEVLVMAGCLGLLSLLILSSALKLERIGSGWTVLGDALIAVVLGGVLAMNVYSTTLSTAQRDLPPALQSYWFPPHLLSLIFSYMTLSIAAVVTVIYFCMRFWGGVLRGGRSRASQLLVLAMVTLVPFAQFATLPLFLLVGAVLVVLKLSGRMPGPEFFERLEQKMDAVSYRTFCVGIPFLTAGLFMGAFWAQEAWANYWGWDSKENSALITWLVYVIYIHVRMLGGYRGEKAMAVLMGGAVSILITFQLFGYMPDSQKSLHRYTDDGVVPREGQQGATVSQEESARLEEGK